ncbi:MAG: hypothetical protein GOVbin7759_5 [Prokaryotic dsDNA virus sp.]|jgi:hypothetical protein|nr:MAG: hypothetical protein GOVbin7759_5 [Prokaryotic dsDNA virus sp.]|tara:strand:- start:416 stop:835 length:420 start_codon:yes stop_codon:yes gene_type:complete
MKPVLVALQEYGAVIFGLVVGTVAHFGRLLSDGQVPTWTQALGYFMQLGLIGLVAVVATKMLGLTDSDTRALATAILAISAQEVVRYLKARGWQHLARYASPADAAQAEQELRAWERAAANGDLEKLLKKFDKDDGDGR